MDLYPIKPTYHVRAYAFGERLIPEIIGKKDVPVGVVAEARAKNGEPHGKTEAWDIFWAAEDAIILAGIRDGAGREELFEALKAQDYDSMMFRHPISAGDTIYVSGGILHAFGPDALVFEVQQTSDLGQFVMPEDLYGNSLGEEEWDSNIEATLDELKTDYLPRPNPGLALEGGINRHVLCCAGPYFALERWTLAEPHVEPSHPHLCTTFSCVEGAVDIEYAGGVERLENGGSCILPAAIGEVNIVPEGEASLVVCYVPDVGWDVLSPLRETGHANEEIRALGELSV